MHGVCGCADKNRFAGVCNKQPPLLATLRYLVKGSLQQQTATCATLVLPSCATTTAAAVPSFFQTQQTVSPEPSIQFQQQSAQAQSHASSSNSSTAWSFGTHSEQNKREHMEDRFVATDLTGTPAFSTAQRAGFFAVYDGHSGHEAAEYLEAHLQSYVLAAGADALAADPCKVLSAAVQQVESEIVSSFAAGGGPETAGSTLCAMLLVDNNLYVANVGDSRAVLAKGTEIKQLTRDHKPGCSIEAARICLDDPNADISGDGYMYGEIAVARAIGSAAWKRDPTRRALIPTPETGSFDVTDQDFVLLATDGLWDKVDNTQVIRGLCWWLFLWWWLPLVLCGWIVSEHCVPKGAVGVCACGNGGDVASCRHILRF